MSLPVIPVPRDVVKIGDVEVSVRGLTRAEAMKVQAAGPDLDAIEVLLIAYGTDTPVAEVEEWRNAIPAGHVEVLVDAIVRLSGMGPGAQFRG